MNEYQREHYRVVFPAAIRPVFHTAEGQFEVVDLSESGLRFTDHSHREFQIGDRMDGYVEFSDGEQITVEGGVLRAVVDEENDHGTVLILAHGMTPELIVRAQRQIIRQYPGFADETKGTGKGSIDV